MTYIIIIGNASRWWRCAPGGATGSGPPGQWLSRYCETASMRLLHCESASAAAAAADAAALAGCVPQLYAHHSTQEDSLRHDLSIQMMNDACIITRVPRRRSSTRSRRDDARVLRWPSVTQTYAKRASRWHGGGVGMARHGSPILMTERIR